jgi:hypothetical protein
MFTYSPDDYDSHLALKPPFLLIAIMVYCALPLIFILIAYNPSPRFQASFSYLQHYATPLSFLGGIPAALVLFAWTKRLPTAGRYWRLIWRWGKWLLSVSLMTHNYLLFSQRGLDIWNSFTMLDSDRLVVVNMGMDLLFVYYLWRVQRVTDVFADFPSSRP